MAKQSPPKSVVNSLEFSRRAEHIHHCLNSTVCYANELDLIYIPLFSIQFLISPSKVCVLPLEGTRTVSNDTLGERP